MSAARFKLPADPALRAVLVRALAALFTAEREGGTAWRDAADSLAIVVAELRARGVRRAPPTLGPVRGVA